MITPFEVDNNGPGDVDGALDAAVPGPSGPDGIVIATGAIRVGFAADG